ncbi:hypothetical protein [Bradyrhizobium elkanii]|uniref:Uncharacterized protein n=1 Tax=Bradyrhizobium elkanii TaxID=29448 RepID=A0ABV4EZW8_BRAEL|nr:hypothetical protein [Bradyrhizobium elkanii]MCP1757740.1 hypothetical protein [Bradyrhizobium elkanii]MCS3881963.1 hypothetical protein [Bradyrhizobium elkanii]MCS4218723.1 hypothetical protein [Bradyrhizobium elkanii]MCW2109969.1 hypothetical protein [Bradyrhizobium elkanii]MCW2201658.1 hypothetical protein [Bradyrhizobium elkanii]
MTTSSSLEDRIAALGWLAHGGELAVGLKGDRAKHSDVIWQLLVEAVEVIDKTPDQERRWLTSGSRSGGWNMIGMTRADLQEIERIRLLSAMKPYDGTTKTSPQRNDVDRALGVLGWMRWCNAARLADRLAKAAIALARGGDQEAVHRLYCPTRKPNRQNIGEIRTRTVGFILTGLKNEMQIVPAQGLAFREVHNVA